jgi:hypothetical protein
MPDPLSKQIIIRGVTSSGHTFRPSDWAERLAGVLSVFGIDSRINYSPYVHPKTVNGTKSIVVDRELERIDARAWNFVMSFAHDNDLTIEDQS